jgi:hypothetical protein
MRSSFTQPKGGLFFWARLTGANGKLADANELAKRAIEKLVAFVPGAPFFAEKPDVATLRLSFATADVAKIEEGVKRLGQANRAFRARSGRAVQPRRRQQVQVVRNGRVHVRIAAFHLGQRHDRLQRLQVLDRGRHLDLRDGGRCVAAVDQCHHLACPVVCARHVFHLLFQLSRRLYT